MLSRTSAVSLGLLVFMVGCATMKLPGQSGADYALQRDALGTLMFSDQIADDSHCGHRNVVNTEITDPPRNPGKDPWVEKWTLDRCGKLIYYKVTFTPTPVRGGTDYSVSTWE